MTHEMIVVLEHDHDCENPATEDGWSPYSFSTNHINYRDPDELDPDEDAELRAKLESGLAFMLSYYEHGRCLWSLQGEGPQCRWDSVRTAGFLVWEDDESGIGAKTYEDRRKDALRFLESWNAWVNGDCYFYLIKDTCDSCGGDGEVVESCGGFLGAASTEHMFNDIREHLDGKSVKFKGEAKYLADYHWKVD